MILSFGIRPGFDASDKKEGPLRAISRNNEGQMAQSSGLTSSELETTATTEPSSRGAGCVLRGRERSRSAPKLRLKRLLFRLCCPKLEQIPSNT